MAQSVMSEHSPLTNVPGFDSQICCHMWVKFVGSLLFRVSAPRGFSPNILFFLSPQNQYDLICIKSDVISFMHDPTSYMYSALNIIV